MRNEAGKGKFINFLRQGEDARGQVSVLTVGGSTKGCVQMYQNGNTRESH